MSSWFLRPCLRSSTIRRVLNLSAVTTMEYKSNNGQFYSTEIDIPSQNNANPTSQTRCKINQASASRPKQIEARIHDPIHPTLHYRELPHLHTPEKNNEGESLLVLVPIPEDSCICLVSLLVVWFCRLVYRCNPLLHVCMCVLFFSLKSYSGTRNIILHFAMELNHLSVWCAKSHPGLRTRNTVIRNCNIIWQ